MERDRNLNFLWLRCLVEEVLQWGADTAVVSPGGRALALCLELRHNPRVKRIIPHTDERSGAFMAMGIARTSGRPVIIATTSGSAVANLMPALMEASALRIPLILLTCDRLRHFRDSGCGQMADHIGICRSVATVSLDLSDPSADEAAILELRHRVSAAVAHTADPEGGIVHINIPLDGYNDTTAVTEGWQPPLLSPLAMHGRMGPDGHRQPMVPAQAGMHRTRSARDLVRTMKLRPGLRGLIVAGPECPLSPQRLSEFVKAVGYPVIADTASGLRRPDVPHVLSGIDALALKPGIRKYHPELLIRLGLPPVLPVVEHYVSEHQCPAIRISNHMLERDYLHDAFELLVRPDDDELAALAIALAPGDTDWLNEWRTLAASGSVLRRRHIIESSWGELAATSEICNAPGFGFLHLGNSMAIRNADICVEAAGLSGRVFSNRGVNGIDGTIGTFIGELIGTNDSGLLLIGDQAFLHDLPALAAVRNSSGNGCICVINNGGGAIFDFLPAAQLPGYADTIRSTGDIEIEGAAWCFRLPYHRCESRNELVAALEACRTAGGLRVIEVRVPPRSLVEDLLSLYDVLEAAHVENCA